MNLFCFSLEGSMDSLYEAVKESCEEQAVKESCEEQVYTIPSSPALLSEEHRWRSAGRCISMELSHINTEYMKKTRRRSLTKSISETEALDNSNTVCANSIWQAARTQEDLVLLRNNQNEDLVRAVRLADYQTTSDRQTQTISRNTQGLPVQIVYKDGFNLNLNQDQSGSGQKNRAEMVNGDVTQVKSTRVKKIERNGSYRNTPTQETAGHIKGAKKLVPVLLDVGPQAHTQENAVGSRVTQTAPLIRQRWSNPAETNLTWVPARPFCQPPTNENRVFGYNCAASRVPSQGDQFSVQRTDPSPKIMVHSTTSVDFNVSNRSTSFGRFDTFRQNSPSKLEEHGTTETEGESTAENCEKPGSLGKKMKAISLTMRKRMGKKHVKSYSEDMTDDTEGEAENGSLVEKSSDQTSNSLESVYSGQSSSSGVASSSDVSSNRDSLKLEEEAAYTGPFCGRAKVHTDFVPSPYDTDSLKLKAGDIINIISKPPMGIWTGMLNNKVGNFKFIYVDVLPEKDKEEEEQTPKIRTVKICRKPRPNTLLELLERLQLEEYASSLLLNGYQTVDDLKHLKERHLIELNMTDADHRRRLLAASECLYVSGRDEQEETKDEEEDEDNDCLRDSGCFIPVECSDNVETLAN